jgi:hypothetical protein
MGYKFRVATSEDIVINITNKNYYMASYFLGIDIRVRITSRKTNVKKKVVHFGIPNSRRLLRTINRFIKVKNKARVIQDISRRLFHVYFFFEIPM